MKHNLNKEPKGRKKQKVSSTGFRGVSKHGKGYRAKLTIDGKQTYLGTFDTKTEAAIAHDHAVHKRRLPKSWLNFPAMKHNLNKEPKGKKKQKVNSTGFRGVTMEKRTGRYFARLSVDGTTKGLGTFDSAEAAAHAYDQAVLKYTNPVCV
jgi:hypothetical protein